MEMGGMPWPAERAAAAKLGCGRVSAQTFVRDWGLTSMRLNACCGQALPKQPHAVWSGTHALLQAPVQGRGAGGWQLGSRVASGIRQSVSCTGTKACRSAGGAHSMFFQVRHFGQVDRSCWSGRHWQA